MTPRFRDRRRPNVPLPVTFREPQHASARSSPVASAFPNTFAFVARSVRDNCGGHGFERRLRSLAHRRGQALSRASKAEVSRFSEQFPALVGLRKDIEIDIIQVQQYLQDYFGDARPRRPDDGLAQADKYAKKLPADIDAATALAKSLDSPELVPAFAAIRKAFPTITPSA